MDAFELCALRIDISHIELNFAQYTRIYECVSLVQNNAPERPQRIGYPYRSWLRSYGNSHQPPTSSPRIVLLASVGNIQKWDASNRSRSDRVARSSPNSWRMNSWRTWRKKGNNGRWWPSRKRGLANQIELFMAAKKKSDRAPKALTICTRRVDLLEQCKYVLVWFNLIVQNFIEVGPTNRNCENLFAQCDGRAWF